MNQESKLAAHILVTESLLDKIADVSATQSIDLALWDELLDDANAELIDITKEIALDEYGGLTNPAAQLRIIHQTIRIEMLEYFNERLHNTLPTGED